MLRTLFASILMATSFAHAGIITGSTSSRVTGTVDLTALGTIDWTHYGRQGAGTISLANETDSLIGGTAIGPLTLDSPNIAKGYGFSPSTFTWSNGTPTGAFNQSYGAVSNDGAQTTGGMAFHLDVEATTSSRQLLLYLGMLQGNSTDPNPLGTLTLTLNDGNTTPLVLSNLGGFFLATINFTASGPATLNVNWSSPTVLFGGAGSVIVFDAAALTDGPVTGGDVPEPGTVFLVLAGLAAAGYRRFRYV